MLIIECINKKEFQANRGKFNVIGLCKLSPHLAKPLSYIITPIFLYFRTLRMPTCAKDRQTGWRYLLFSFKCIFSNCGHAQNAMVTGTQVPVGNRDSGTRAQNLYPSQPYSAIHKIWPQVSERVPVLKMVYPFYFLTNFRKIRIRLFVKDNLIRYLIYILIKIKKPLTVTTYWSLIFWQACLSKQWRPRSDCS